jgi:phospholipid/cholesterol/gamma-HCH transport system substrate-binding protein
MSEQRMQFAIGIVTLAAGLALAAIILWFGEFQFTLAPSRNYTVTFVYAPGVEPKVPLRRSGVRVGEVRTVAFDEASSKVMVVVGLEGPHQLLEGDVPTLKRSFPLGDTYIDIETRPDARGKPDRQPIPPNSVLEGRSPPDTTATLENALQAVPKLNAALNQIELTARQWDEVGRRANLLLDANEQRITVTLEDARVAMERLVVVLDDFHRTLDAPTQENVRVMCKNLRETSERLKPTLERFDETVKKFDEVAVNLKAVTKPLAERSASIAKNVDTSAERLSVVLADLEIVARRLRDDDGTIQRLMRDPSLYQNLDDAAVLLVDNLKLMEKLLVDLRVFADKIARHPGELGVQGILTKDSGVKTIPPGTRKR